MLIERSIYFFEVLMWAMGAAMVTVFGVGTA